MEVGSDISSISNRETQFYAVLKLALKERKGRFLPNLSETVRRGEMGEAMFACCRIRGGNGGLIPALALGRRPWKSGVLTVSGGSLFACT